MITLNKLRALSESADYHDPDFIPGIGFDDLQDFDESAFTFNDFDSEDSINESIGSEIWKKIKAAFHAIRKFFVMIGTKIKNFVLGFFKKNDEELDDFIKNDLDNKAKDVADSEKIVNDIKKEAGVAIKNRHEEFKKQMKDFNSNIKNNQENMKKDQESIDQSFEDLSKMINKLDGSTSEDLNRIKDIGNYCEKVKQKNPKLAEDILDILDSKEPEIKKVVVSQKKRYDGRIMLYEYATGRASSANRSRITLNAIYAIMDLAYGKEYMRQNASKVKDTVLCAIFNMRFTDYVSSIISGKNADKSEFDIDDTEINTIKETFELMCSAHIDKADKNFLSDLGIVYCDKKQYGVSLCPRCIQLKTFTNISVSDLVKIAKGFNGKCKAAAKGWQNDFDKAASEMNKMVSELDSYAKNPKSGEYAEIFKKHAQVCNKIVGVIQFNASVYSNAFIALSRMNTQRIKAFANGGYKQYEVKQ